ncbi:4Fe-4S ferredoxin N-terminal domain-containing protein [Halopiger aswanensis]|uniref:Molybdopterin-containing oxidoreductase family iron-sulfur binding subunit n=1 Tax=Halopiger aswanensis TaxID=148449 RepID=A0A419WI00_9EURY|nr:4Fe-4S ferredoxin N-terminal domain-containing protein [Halopiger aswanensis]RKD94996.1 molybdopterin-containing oxidoreductase family iron-sulfur binding subunit [Halopiger aswanensis]
MSPRDEDTSDDGFHPLGEAAEEEFEKMLEDTEYDAELGMEMAKDAMRVTKGELSDEAFYDRYHEDVMDEFGEDSRPMAEEIEAKREEQSPFERTLSRFGLGDESRRDMMKKMGAGAGIFGFGAWSATSDGADAEPNVAAQNESGNESGNESEGGEGEGHGGDETQWGMAIDLESCDGCLSCVVACNAEHNWDEGANWMYVLAYEDGTVESPEPDDFESTRDFNYIVRPCQHCTDAPCEKVCPTTARHTRDQGGLVLTDYDVCIGCRYCQVACPYGVNYFQWDEPNVDAEEMSEEMMYDQRDRWVSGRGPRGVMQKCVFDPARQDGQMGEDLVGTTACEQACPPGAIQFGDMNDPESDPQQYIEDIPLARARNQATDDNEEVQEAIAILEGEQEPADEEGGDGMTEEEASQLLRAEFGDTDSSYRLLEEYDTHPNVLYIGNEPGSEAEQVPGPVSYEEVGMVDNRHDVLEEETVDGGLEL